MKILIVTGLIGIIGTPLLFSQTPPLAWADETGGSHCPPVLADLDHDGIPEILMTASNLEGADTHLVAWHGDGRLVSGFPVEILGPASSVVVGDVLGVHDLPKIAVGTTQRIYLLHANGAVMPGWPVTLVVGNVQPISMADLDSDGDLEILVTDYHGLMAYHHDGTRMPGFLVVGDGPLTGLAVGDLDADGDVEIVAGNYGQNEWEEHFVYAWNLDSSSVRGFPVPAPGQVRGTPLLVDLDDDPMLEIVFGAYEPYGDGVVSVLSHSGTTEPGWPFVSRVIHTAVPVAADLDRDGRPEIVVGGGGLESPIGSSIFAFRGDGSLVAGFPAGLSSLGGNASCVIGDIDGDDDVEILLKTNDHLEAVHHDGSPVDGFPIFIQDGHTMLVQPSPALGDVDGDGLVELFLPAAGNEVALFELEGVASSDLLPWPMPGRVPVHDSLYHPPPLVAERHRISAATGGTLNLGLDAGRAHAERSYLLAIGRSGTYPGLRLPGSGGPVHLPLNWDALTQLALWNLNGPVFAGFGGTLDSDGRATARLDSLGPLPPAFAGTQIYLAFATALPWEFASEPVAIQITP